MNNNAGGYSGDAMNEPYSHSPCEVIMFCYYKVSPNPVKVICKLIVKNNNTDGTFTVIMRANGPQFRETFHMSHLGVLQLYMRLNSFMR